MNYKLRENSVYRIDTQTDIPLSGGNRDYQDYLAWLAEGNTPEPADPPSPPPADWRGFLAAMKTTSIFTTLRSQARADLGANALATELRQELSDAALGNVDVPVIQALVDDLLPSLSEAQRNEVGAAITAFKIPLTLS